MRRVINVSRSGFTLFEILLVLALIGLLSSLFVLNIGSLLRDGELETLEREYWRAVESARAGAVFKQQAHFLEWDADESQFLVKAGSSVESFPVSLDSSGNYEIDVLFEEVAAENSYLLIRGELVAVREIVTVGFFPDGTCSPYTVSLQVEDFVTRFQMDPWTGVELVNPHSGEESAI
ncbi:prepilin-type N-terminal cleavage/methylation domain-containing protein [Pelagicoccus albus]|uniref:Prepilin-type N-terminal cleavage/methylation domain-containing protein n=1 Tax=Pelagicoccus albus TaxID=415222 RepID=A0A7X1B2J9_9BACT|nr:prepilin-type N-terminal cleavage/methylation domain-containing protein [Pelagicoccus albus]MBC2604469.1 prepilin-type N-terminal cleavage/methylation domain-containing protein [Pelagicoccus albus]